MRDWSADISVRQWTRRHICPTVARIRGQKCPRSNRALPAVTDRLQQNGLNQSRPPAPSVEFGK